MPSVNPTFQQQIFALTAYAYANNIDCPPLKTLNSWMISGQTPTTSPTTIGRKAGGRPRSSISTTRGQSSNAPAPGTFSAAVLSAMTSAPNGISQTALGRILAPYKKKPNVIGLALARLAKQKLVAKNGDLWSARSTGAIDRILVSSGRAAA